MKKSYLYSALIALFVTIVTIKTTSYFEGKNENVIRIEHVNNTPKVNALYTKNKNGEIVTLDFTAVAEDVMDAVVHIKSTHTMSRDNNFYHQQIPDPLRKFFKDDHFENFFHRKESPNMNLKPQLRIGQGSGVIISENGYIVTNNHVVADADDLEVTLHDNRNYKATVIGTDPTTDLALIQIKEKGLTYLPFVNSDKVKVGEWVLAVGNPFNLTSTVTAGIVSAKGRNINILKEKFAVESFIQTDAAINPGNSGGALVNLDGGLIGINTAIASSTGSYAGYGFAIPSNIAGKVVEDLMKYGMVQRGVLGVIIRNVDGNLKKDKDLNLTEGAYVDSLMEKSAAATAGIEVGDVIVAVDGNEIDNSSSLQEAIAQHRPGDMVKVKINRKGKEKVFNVTLSNRKGNIEFLKKEHKEILNILGIDIETLDKKTSKKLDISGGVKVKNLYAGKLRKYTDIREGFIITKVDGQKVESVEDFIKKLKNKKGGVMLEGIYEDIPGEYYYAFGL